MAGGISEGTPTAGGGSALPRIPGISDSGLSAQINVTPMIDVMLVLLIIFMVVTPILTQYEATPPSAITARPEPDDNVVTIGIDRGGSFYVENDAVAPLQLAASLESALSGQAFGERLVYLRADRSVSYARIMDAVEAAREAGVATIGAITEPFEAETDAETRR
jgi:biopolymer transport protein TolR